ncbi:spliceosome-associated protein 130 A, partial [Tanacetum coccineum]
MVHVQGLKPHMFNYIGDIVTCMEKASLNPHGVECLMYGTVMGSLGALLSFTSRANVDFFSHLKKYMRHELPHFLALELSGGEMLNDIDLAKEPELDDEYDEDEPNL